jgi:D-aspartate ligase
MEAKALVLGDVDLLRPLVLAGVDCAVVAVPGDPVRFSRFASESLEWADHWTEQELLVERLMGWARLQEAPPVLFYQSTGDLLTVSRHRDRLRKAFRYVVADAQLVEELTDKASFQLLAERLGLPVPPTLRLAPADDPGGWRVDLRFPLILKPVTRHFERWRSIGHDAKAVRVDTPERLRRLWAPMSAAGADVLAQELIEGPEAAIESYHVYAGEGGEIVAHFTGKKIRTRPVEFGFSTAVAITDAADVAALGHEVTRRLGLTGVAKLDFKRAPGGELYLLEINPRFTLWHHPAAVAGLNIPALVLADLTGRARPPAPHARAGIRWCEPWEDAAAAREAGGGLARWLREALTYEAKSGLSWDDPFPFVRGVALPHLRTRLRRRIRRHFAAARPDAAAR